MKVLFLDFDGVLNSEKWFMDHQEEIRATSGLLWRHKSELDPACCACVEKIIEDTQCSIVVSSSWRIGMSVRELRACLIEAGFPRIADAIIDRTPVFSEIDHEIDGRRAIRGDEIKAWLDKHPEVTKFVVLDDGDDMLIEQPLVQTSWAVGITAAHVHRAREILNGP